jgi:hypothetical protein
MDGDRPVRTALGCRPMQRQARRSDPSASVRRSTSDVTIRVQIGSQAATACKRFIFSCLESGICGGSQPTLSAALAARSVTAIVW